MATPLDRARDDRIKKALERIIQPCPLCGVRNWIFGVNLVLVPTGPAPSAPRSLEQVLGPVPWSIHDFASQLFAKEPGPTLALLPLMCQNCGNTVFINVYRVGIADLWDLPSERRV